jgi:hypothetical protein
MTLTLRTAFLNVRAIGASGLVVYSRNKMSGGKKFGNNFRI